MMKRVVIRLGNDEYQALKQAIYDNPHYSLSDVIRLLVNQFIATYKPHNPMPEDFELRRGRISNHQPFPRKS